MSKLNNSPKQLEVMLLLPLNINSMYIGLKILVNISSSFYLSIQQKISIMEAQSGNKNLSPTILKFCNSQKLLIMSIVDLRISTILSFPFHDIIISVLESLFKDECECDSLFFLLKLFY